MSVKTLEADTSETVCAFSKLCTNFRKMKNVCIYLFRFKKFCQLLKLTLILRTAVYKLTLSTVGREILTPNRTVYGLSKGAFNIYSKEYY